MTRKSRVYFSNTHITSRKHHGVMFTSNPFQLHIPQPTNHRRRAPLTSQLGTYDLIPFRHSRIPKSAPTLPFLFHQEIQQSSPRYIPITMSEDAAPPAAPATQAAPTSIPRYFRNDAPLARRDPHKQLLASLDRLITDYPPHHVPPGGGLYYGPISVAYLFYALHNIYPDLTLDEYPLNTWSAALPRNAAFPTTSCPCLRCTP